MMKNKFIALALIVCLGLLLWGCSSPSGNTSSPSAVTPAATTGATTAAPSNSPSGKIYTIKHADLNPEGSLYATNAMIPFMKQIEDATGGRVKIEKYFSESLTKGSQAWEATKDGVADMAWMSHANWKNMTPLSDVVALPFMNYKNAEQASAILWQLYEKYPSIREEYKDNHIISLWSSASYFLVNNGKHVKTMEDLRGMKIRVLGGPPTEMMTLLGGTPVMVSMPDTYMNIKNGVIDGMGQMWQGLLDWKTYEVVKYYTYVPMFTVYFSFAMNNNVWNSLPSDIQKQIETVGGLAGSKFMGKNIYDAGTALVPNMLKEKGLTLNEYTLPAEELNRWTEKAGKPLWEKWVQTMESQGHPEARDILNTTLELIKTYNP